ncbi:phosphate ABC transporter substrate-binding protein, PhoT family [Paraburkholderia ginsengiterrae]|uniref:Phosphate ABC transporter substrate-binding protein, PhoT family n=1 Tax=Paraburkholderia ginsengiterrae TaxID=1462993 RepID=A0A1A9N689_9BURK|nr:substrate-binding domain-containing protein [Paraburkholderia ginsengiterrae]OAJ52015.1 phosphate ABC transporter substrate-binding protein, PhoT family [Paraburkholderia ginsengiterrae]OAJ60006.1 phosphate ABC transporter substrate-binding protein, PhoT family [Paraburkholderia ginsengiterrae]
MKQQKEMRVLRKYAAVSSAAMIGIAALGTLASPSAFALKYAAVEHHLTVDSSIPSWQPGPVDVHPEEELNIVGADVMDEITLGWIKEFREAYPRLSVTMEARASGSGGPALTAGTADLAPVGRELLPAEEKAFVDKYGYKPLAIRVATGSVGSLGKTAASVVIVDKDNPIKGLTLAQLDAIYSKTRNRGHADISTWGDLGLGGDWANRPIHLYGLKPVNGIEYYLQMNVLEGGAYKDNIQFVKGKGFTHAFTVAAEDMATHPGGLTYALLANVRPNVKVVPLATTDGQPFVLPTVQTVYTHQYPLSRYVYIFVNKKPGEPLQPKIKEFLKLVLSKQGQDVVAKEGVYIPLTPAVVKEELAKLDQAS